MSLEQLRKHATANPLRVDTVEIDGLPTLYVREMDAEGMAAFLKLNEQREDDATYSAVMTAGIVAIHLCNISGKLDVSPADRDKVAAELAGSLKFADLVAVFNACMTVSGMAVDEGEEIAGN